MQKPTKIIYLIRHAQSQYNIAEKNLKQKVGEQYLKSAEYLSMKFDLAREDTGITKQGYKQSAECAEAMKDKKIDLVIVSPLRRAMMTCHQIFKDHSQKPHIIVDPDFREIMESACDIGSLLGKSKAQFPYFDYSLIDDIDAWYVHTLKHPQHRETILNKIKQVQHHQRNTKAKQATLQVLKQVWSERCNGNTQLKELMLANVVKQRQRLLDLAKKYNSIAVVSHSENIKKYVGYKIKNCQVYELKLQQLQKMDFENDSQPWSGLKIEQDAL